MLNEQAVKFTLISDNIMLKSINFWCQFQFEGDQHITTHLDQETHVIISHLILAYKCNEYDLMKTVGTNR